MGTPNFCARSKTTQYFLLSRYSPSVRGFVKNPQVHELIHFIHTSRIIPAYSPIAPCLRFSSKRTNANWQIYFSTVVPVSLITNLTVSGSGTDGNRRSPNILRSKRQLVSYIGSSQRLCDRLSLRPSHQTSRRTLLQKTKHHPPPLTTVS